MDGSVHASGNRSMLFHTYTAVHSDGLGVFLKANANAEMISTFTYYCQVGFACIGGSKIRSLNSSNAYGEYGVYSAGFDAGETANQGTIKGQMLVYTNVLTTSFQDGEQITGGTSGATAYVVNVQAEPKRIYVVQISGTFQSSETVTGGSSGATATLTSGTATVNQSGRILVTTFSTTPDAGDSLQFASTDGNAYQIQSVSSVTANSVAYKVLVFSTSRATAVAENVNVLVRKEFSLARLTGHDFLQIGTGGTDTTNWPNNPTQSPAQADQVVTNETDPGRVYYTATDELGNFYVGDQFKVDQATGNVTLDASAFNLSGLESLRLGSVGGLIGAAVGEFSTDVTLSQNSDTKVSTQKAVKTYVDTLDDVTPVGGTFTVAGISTVTGTTQFTKQLNVSGVSTFHGNVNLLDGDRLRVGSSEDLQVYHDGNHSYIAENGGGDLKIQASAGSIFIQKSTGEEMIKATVDGAVELYHDDVKTIETLSSGAKVTGALEVTGNVSIGGTLTYEDVTNIDSVGIVTANSGIFVPDSQVIHVGGSSGAGDLQIYHDTNNSYVKDNGTGDLLLQTQGGYVKIRYGTDTMALFQPSNKAELYYANSAKLATTNTGVTITGTASATTFSGSGASLTSLPAANLTGTIAAISGANLTNLNGSNIASGTVPVARIGTGTKNTSTFYRGDGTFATVTAPAISSIANDGGNRVLTSDGDGTATAESTMTFDGNQLILNQSNDSKLSLKVPSSDGDDWNYIDFVGRDGTRDFFIGTWSDGTPTWSRDDGSTRIFLNNGNINFANATLRPNTNNTHDLGTPTNRWRNVYTGDLHLSNEGMGNINPIDANMVGAASTSMGNSVDNTWGDWTIQEGENDLFILNNRNGKKYKFNLTEVS